MQKHMPSYPPSCASYPPPSRALNKASTSHLSSKGSSSCLRSLMWGKCHTVSSTGNRNSSNLVIIRATKLTLLGLYRRTQRSPNILNIRPLISTLTPPPPPPPPPPRLPRLLLTFWARFPCRLPTMTAVAMPPFSGISQAKLKQFWEYIICNIVSFFSRKYTYDFFMWIRPYRSQIWPCTSSPKVEGFRPCPRPLSR